MKRIVLSILMAMTPMCLASGEQKVDKVALQTIKDELGQFYTFELAVESLHAFCNDHNVSPDIVGEFFDNDTVNSFLKEASHAVAALIINESKSTREAIIEFFMSTQGQQFIEEIRSVVGGLCQKYIIEKGLPEECTVVESYLFECLDSAFVASIVEEIEVVL